MPFGLFVSLSAGELVLPTISEGGLSSDSHDKPRAQGLVKQVYSRIWEWVESSMDALGMTNAYR